jgi:hypothetical protein
MTEVKAKANPLLDQPLEIRLWLEGKMHEELTNKEILALLNQKFPFVNGITSQNIASYRKKYTPNYQELMLQKYGMKAQTNPEDVEQEILAEVREAETAGEEFTKEEKRKINMLTAYRRILSEMWNNYRVVKPTKDETAKRGYLVEMIKALTVIKELEQSEKSFLSAMDEIRKAEQKMDINKCIDSIQAWSVPRMLEKSKNKEEALEYVSKLQSYLNNFSQIITGSATMEEANRILLERLYVVQKVKQDESEEKT